MNLFKLLIKRDNLKKLFINLRKTYKNKLYNLY